MYAYPISTHKTEQIEPLNPTVIPSKYRRQRNTLTAPQAHNK